MYLGQLHQKRFVHSALLEGTYFMFKILANGVLATIIVIIIILTLIIKIIIIEFIIGKLLLVS